MVKSGLSRKDFTQIQRGRANRVHGTLFSLTVAPLKRAAPFKFACVVSKKIARRAVDRNRIKRFCREAVRKESRRLKRVETFVLYAKREASKASYAEVVRDVEGLVRKVS